MINYYCPGFVEAQPVYQIIFDLYKQFPYCFNEGVKIHKIFGNFPNMIWNGGTVWRGPAYSRQDVIDYFNWYATQNVSLQLVCTNPVLTEMDMHDRYCNMILEVASHYDFVEVLVSSDILEKYIRNTYPHMKLDKSIIGTSAMLNTNLDNIEGYCSLLDKYNVIVLPKKYGKDLSFLSNIPKDKRNRIEILVTDPCPNNCPNIYSHYQDYGRAQLGEISSRMANYCTSVSNAHPFRSWANRNCQYDYKQIVEELVPLGYTEIKISGRTNATYIVLSIVPFLFKEEFHKDIYALLLGDYSADIMPPAF